MNTEEKAKRYDEALAYVRNVYRLSSNPAEIQRMVEIFPELKESEDERIRKDLITWLKNIEGQALPIDRYNAALAWLEKQGKFVENKDDEDDSDTDFTIYHPLKNGKGHYECIPYSFYGTLTSFSEDKDLIDFLRLCFYTKEECNEWIKQNESADNVESKFHEGDWVIYMGTTAKILDLQKHCYVGKDTNDKDFVVSYCNEYEMKKWDISDVKDGDVLSNGEMIVIFKHFEEPSYRQHIVAYIGLDINGNIQITDDTWNFGIDKIKPATKEQRDILFTKMKEIGYEWDTDKKELKKISQRMVSAEAKEALYDKPTDEEMKELLRTEYEKGRADAIAEMEKDWSEEDEVRLQACIDCLQAKSLMGKIDTVMTNWLKSLKDRYTWKPRKELIEALEDEVRNNETVFRKKVLNELLEQLKKL